MLVRCRMTPAFTLGLAGPVGIGLSHELDVAVPNRTPLTACWALYATLPQAVDVGLPLAINIATPRSFSACEEVAQRGDDTAVEHRAGQRRFPGTDRAKRSQQLSCQRCAPARGGFHQGDSQHQQKHISVPGRRAVNQRESRENQVLAP